MDEGTGARRPAGALEAELLAVLQSAEAALTPGDVAGRMGGELSYSTVVTVLSRMHAKGTLNRERSGRAYAYSPVLDAAGMAARRMREVLENERDRDAVLTRFVGELSPRDEALFRRLLSSDDGQE
ncbi:Penicillinase repressor [Actinomadura rubteroloni]|uniref:Penicillinase repressor n=1 Tax=Actinomadura rubteroloni TaxID=1926885 RepID=A0A2P4UE28_9ACTN|nr:BlaI/MecI/CopY family transcriptional regulator [Actinomadura rubteroloni]POM23305.1 Penicillinase repressor [Actinomadura rubteroloni]